MSRFTALEALARRPASASSSAAAAGVPRPALRLTVARRFFELVFPFEELALRLARDFGASVEDATFVVACAGSQLSAIGR